MYYMSSKYMFTSRKAQDEMQLWESHTHGSKLDVEALSSFTSDFIFCDEKDSNGIFSIAINELHSLF